MFDISSPIKLFPYLVPFFFFQNKQYVSVYVDNSSAYNIVVQQESDFTGILLGI